MRLEMRDPAITSNRMEFSAGATLHNNINNASTIRVAAISQGLHSKTAPPCRPKLCTRPLQQAADDQNAFKANTRHRTSLKVFKERWSSPESSDPKGHTANKSYSAAPHPSLYLRTSADKHQLYHLTSWKAASREMYTCSNTSPFARVGTATIAIAASVMVSVGCQGGRT